MKASSFKPLGQSLPSTSRVRQIKIKIKKSLKTKSEICYFTLNFPVGVIINLEKGFRFSHLAGSDLWNTAQRPQLKGRILRFLWRFALGVPRCES